MGFFSTKCSVCGSLEHSTIDCPHGIISTECTVCGSKDHATKDCPHGAFSTKCSVCGSKNHASKDCPHGAFSTKCSVCGSKDHATKDCPHGAFSTKCSICGSHNHATKDCPQGGLGNGKSKKHPTKSYSSSSGEGGLTEFFGKIIGWLIVAAIIVMVVVWLALNIVLPVVLLNSALILTVLALSFKQHKTLFAVFALVGGGYMILDIINGWFSANFVENVVKNPEWISAFVYINAIAIGLSTWFLVQPILSNVKLNSTSNKRKNVLLLSASILLVTIITISTPLIYHTIENPFVSKFYNVFQNSNNTNSAGNDLKTMGLQGNVKNLREIKYNAVEKSGEITKGSKVGELSFEFDLFGNKNVWIFSTSNGELRRVTYQYENGYLIEEINFEPNGSLSYRISYKYDNTGNILEETFYNSASNVWARRETYKYDNKNNKIEWIDYLSDGTISLRSTHKYNEGGNEIEQNRYSSDGSLLDKWIFKHDEKGNVIELYDYEPDGSLDRTFLKQYDEKGNKIEVSIYRFGKLISKETWIYDEKGNIIDQTELGPNGSLIQKYTYKNEFDNNGNWIKQISYEYDIPLYVIEREIVYYD